MSVKQQLLNIVQTKDPQRPDDWKQFMAEACMIFRQKSTDYEDRFIKALMTMDAHTLWAWEVDKKLDRIRTWLKRGELQVKTEGIRNSVDDLFIYTVQYVAWNSTKEDERPKFLDRVQHNRSGFLYWHADTFKPKYWVDLLEEDGRIHKDEKLLKLILRQYMGDTIRTDEWQSAIRTMLKEI